MKDKETNSKARRDWGSGSVFKQRNVDTWTVQFNAPGIKMRGGKPVLDGAGNPIRGRIRIREATGFTSKRRALDYLAERKAQVSNGTWFKLERHPATVWDLLNGLSEHYLANDRASTEKGLEWRRRHLEPVLGMTLAANLTTDDITRYIRSRQAEGAASATINRELAALRHAFRMGQRTTPPKVRTAPHVPMLRENNTRRGFVEDTEFEKLTSQRMDLWMRTLIELGYTYGWRAGELTGLRVAQVNLMQRTIRLDPGTTKNGEGREVAMTAKLHELLQACVEGKRGSDYVLTRAGNRPVKEFRKTWRNLCVSAGLGEFLCAACSGPWTGEECASCGSLQRTYRGLIPHDLRRSAAKALRRAGVAESVIMATGGWKTPAMFRRYAIVSNQDQRDAVEALERQREQNSLKSALISSKRPAASDKRVN